MRDRFPLLLIAGFILIGVLGSNLMRQSKRAEFAGPLSTYRSEAEGARGVFLLAQESGLQVGREKRDLVQIEEGASLVLLGVRGGYGDSDFEDELANAAVKPTGADGGTPDEDEDEDETAPRGLMDLLRNDHLTAEEREKVLEHVKEGHTLVYVPPGAPRRDSLLEAVKITPTPAPELKPRLRTLVPAQPSAYTLGVERVEAEVKLHLSLGPHGVPLLVDDHTGAVVAAATPYGDGQIVVLGAPELGMNQALSRADNARFWLSLLEASAAGRDRLLFDEHHHGFRDDRSVAAFAARYGLQFAIAQLLLGLCLWAASLKRFGRPRAPPSEARVGGVDVLSAAGRLYRAGKHRRHAAQLIADGLTQDLASPAGLPLRAKAEDIITALRARNRADLGDGLAEVRALASGADSEHAVVEVARKAAHLRQRLQPRRLSRRAAQPSAQPSRTEKSERK
ncbi:MAG TPA: DUF4350 domain-containing protein [Longimicrobium sp.]|nr:DUF4350 domain-containing protein [Longimicrobium sp.]